MSTTKIKSKDISKLMISNVAIWNSDGESAGMDLFAESGKITEIRRHLPDQSRTGWDFIDGSGLVLIPAGVDAQVHLRVPGQAQKETAASGLWAAVHGGVGAILTMPNTKPVLDEVSVLRQAMAEVEPVERATGVKVLYSAAMTKGQKGHECVDFDTLSEAGVAAFTDDGVGVSSDQVMLAVVSGAAKTGKPILQHAEIPGHGGVLADGAVQKEIGGPAYPSSAESGMVARDLELVRQVPEVRYHVLHVSSAETLALVAAAKKAGLNVSCEVSPHHLYFTSDDIKPGNSSFKMNPPLRSGADRDKLRAALAGGDCDFVATDHAPHEATVKTSNFKTSAFGTTGLETSLLVLLDMWVKGALSSQRLVDVWSAKPAKFLGIDRDFGAIRIGMPLNAVLCDPRGPRREIAEDFFVGLSKNSCFIGSRLPGRIAVTILGQKVHQIGQ